MFETFLFDLSSTFIGLPDETVDLNMTDGLARVGTFLNLDRITLFELSAGRDEMIVAYSWNAPGVSAPPLRITRQTQPWWLARVLRGEATLAARLDDLPEEAATAREYLRQRGVMSVASIPLRVGGEIAGGLSFVTVRREEAWTPETVRRLRAIGDILWNALKRYQAMQQLSRLSQRLLEAQEEERARIARELHDDINQRLALLAMNLELVQQRLPDVSRDVTQQIEEAIEGLRTLTRDVQSLSHRLHSSRLQTVGLESAARALCRELADRSGMEIDFESAGVPAAMPNDVSVCLYRVLQEALQNAVKHSGSPRIAVSLNGDEGAMTLSVRDSGKGFDVSDTLRGPGLGLVSMKERLKLVDGQLTIDAHAAGGTVIRARVPLDAVSVGHR